MSGESSGEDNGKKALEDDVRSESPTRESSQGNNQDVPPFRARVPLFRLSVPPFPPMRLSVIPFSPNFPFVQQTVPPFSQSILPSQSYAPLPRQDLPPLRHEVPPVRQEVPPQRLDVPPLRQEVPPLRLEVPPFRFNLPPPQTVPPTQQNLPPFRQSIQVRQEIPPFQPAALPFQQAAFRFEGSFPNFQQIYGPPTTPTREQASNLNQDIRGLQDRFEHCHLTEKTKEDFEPSKTDFYGKEKSQKPGRLSRKEGIAPFSKKLIPRRRSVGACDFSFHTPAEQRLPTRYFQESRFAPLRGFPSSSLYQERQQISNVRNPSFRRSIGIYDLSNMDFSRDPSSPWYSSSSALGSIPGTSSDPELGLRDPRVSFTTDDQRAESSDEPKNISSEESVHTSSETGNVYETSFETTFESKTSIPIIFLPETSEATCSRVSPPSDCYFKSLARGSPGETSGIETPSSFGSDSQLPRSQMDRDLSEGRQSKTLQIEEISDKSAVASPDSKNKTDISPSIEEKSDVGSFDTKVEAKSGVPISKQIESLTPGESGSALKDRSSEASTECESSPPRFRPRSKPVTKDTPRPRLKKTQSSATSSSAEDQPSSKPATTQQKPSVRGRVFAKRASSFSDPSSKGLIAKKEPRRKSDESLPKKDRSLLKRTQTHVRTTPVSKPSPSHGPDKKKGKQMSSSSDDDL